MQQALNNEMTLVDQEQLQEAERHKQARDQSESRISQTQALVFQMDSPKEKNIELFDPKENTNKLRNQQNQKIQEDNLTKLTSHAYLVQLVSERQEQNQQKDISPQGNKNENLSENKQSKSELKIEGRIDKNYDDKEIENSREDRIRKRKQKSGFKDFLSSQEGIHQNIKNVEYNQKEKQSKNIEYGKQQEHSSQQNQKTNIAIKEDPLARKQNQKNSKQVKQLPTLKQQRSRKHELQPPLIQHNDNSVMALQKYMEAMNYNPELPNYQQGVLNHFAFKPIPERANIKFLLKRQKKIMQNYFHPQYSLFFNSNKLVLNAKKDWGHVNSVYNISCEEKYYARSGRYYAGYLKGNFGGTRFNLFSCHDQEAELVSTICYKADFTCIEQGYRKFQVYIKNEDYAYSQLTGYVQNWLLDLKDLYQYADNASQRKIIKLVNKKAQWSQRLDAYVMNFKGKLKMASVKNTILVEQGKENHYVLMLCKEQQDQFYLQVGYPLDPFMAMGIVLSSFDFKLLCQ